MGGKCGTVTDCCWQTWVEEDRGGVSAGELLSVSNIFADYS